LKRCKKIKNWNTNSASPNQDRVTFLPYCLQIVPALDDFSFHETREFLQRIYHSNVMFLNWLMTNAVEKMIFFLFASDTSYLHGHIHAIQKFIALYPSILFPLVMTIHAPHQKSIHLIVSQHSTPTRALRVIRNAKAKPVRRVQEFFRNNSGNAER